MERLGDSSNVIKRQRICQSTGRGILYVSDLFDLGIFQKNT